MIHFEILRDWQGLGGGVARWILKDCTLRDNTAVYGGGAWNAVLDNCLVVNNVASQDGGGVAVFSTFGNFVWPVLTHCTITGNSAGREGGGVWSHSQNSRKFYCTPGGPSSVPAKLDGCIVHDNNAPLGANHWGFRDEYWQTGHGDYIGGQMSYSCTTPLPTSGVGNIASPPLFVDPASGNFRLQPNAPCINAGRNPNAPGGGDLGGNPRIVGGTVDIGAYEFQAPTATISCAWLLECGLTLDGDCDRVREGSPADDFVWTFRFQIPNDDLADAQVLVGESGSVAGDNRYAFVEWEEPRWFSTPIYPYGSSLWYRWTAPTDGWFTFDRSADHRHRTARCHFRPDHGSDPTRQCDQHGHVPGVTPAARGSWRDRGAGRDLLAGHQRRLRPGIRLGAARTQLGARYGAGPPRRRPEPGAGSRYRSRPVLSVEGPVRPASSPVRFGRPMAHVSMNSLATTGAGLAGDGAEVFGYATAFADALARIGQISPEEFAARFPGPADYLPRISWDPTQAAFWDEFNADPAVVNQDKAEGELGYRTADYRLNAEKGSVLINDNASQRSELIVICEN